VLVLPNEDLEILDAANQIAGLPAEVLGGELLEFHGL